MKLTVLQENLKKATILTSRFISNKLKLPILSNILIKTDKSNLILSATNLESSVIISIPSKVEEEGDITVNGKIFNDLVSNLSSGIIELKSDKEQLNVFSLNFKSKILGTNSSDFPNLSQDIGKKYLKLERNAFISRLIKIIFSISTDETRPVLTGVLFKLTKGNLILVSTDGFRLSEVKIKIETDLDDFSLIIPRSVLLELTRIESEEKEIKMSYDKNSNQIIFKIGDIIITSKIIDGSYPDYQKIIPKTAEIVINIDKYLMEKNIKLASVFARDSGNILKLGLEEKILTLSAESSTTGNQETQIEIDSQDIIKEKMKIMFNAKFLEDVLKVIEADELKISFTGSNTAAVFLDAKDPDFLHLIMPIKS